MNTPEDKQSKEIKENECSDTWIYSQELEDLPWQQSSLGEYEQLSLWKSTPTLNSSCDRTSQEFQFTLISKISTQSQESLKSLPAVFPAREHQTQELERDSNTQLHLFGERDLEYWSRLNPASVLSNNLKELSDEDFELFLVDSLWQDTLGKLAMSRQQSLGRVIRGLDYLSFPTLTSNENSTSRPAGQTKCEKWFKDNRLILSGSQLSAGAIASLMNFPTDWFDPLSPVKPQAESEPDISQVEQLPQHKQQSPFKESYISIPCLVNQPKQPEVKGVIKKDEGDRFLVEVGDEEIFVSKLFVYPDFSKSDGQIPPSKEVTPPSKSSPIKTRRKKGDGTGYIYRRTVTRKGKQYQEAYFRYRDESGKLKAKYIPQKLLSKVEEAESAKKPIADILFLLGGGEISRGEHSSISDNVPLQTSQTENKSDELISINRGEQEQRPRVGVRRKGTRCDTPPSNKKRKQGEGTGYIECKPIKRSGKEYKQYWYHYEEWEGGDRINKKSKYIPKRLVARVERMETEKVSVKEILEVLRGEVTK